jgi:hypothetical protein
VDGNSCALVCFDISGVESSSMSVLLCEERESPHDGFSVCRKSSLSFHSYPSGVRTSAVQEIMLQNYLSGESFSPLPIKDEHSIYINPTPSY